MILLKKEYSSPISENELVERARGGDQEAFGELVRRHRAKAYGWASQIARDAHLAEDIVQDALIRAFLHLSTLVDCSRFLPWLQTIIRNQAYMKLRRGGPFAKERPWGSFAEEASKYRKVLTRNPATDWESLDSILFCLSSNTSQTAAHNGNPEKNLLQKELLEHITRMLNCLNKRERQIFEAHFFRELSPQEIAQLFEISTANVYNLISRSRAKMQKERIRISISVYVNNRIETGHKRVNILPVPHL